MENYTLVCFVVLTNHVAGGEFLSHKLYKNTREKIQHRVDWPLYKSSSGSLIHFANANAVLTGDRGRGHTGNPAPLSVWFPPRTLGRLRPEALLQQRGGRWP